jgi:choice-of-anchor A domain-containing protein
MRTLRHLLFGFLLTLSIPLAATNPWDFNVYTLQNIGTQQNPYGSDFQGIAGSGGDDYFSGFSLNALTGPFVYSLYSGGNVNFQNGSISNGGIEALGNVTVNSASVSGNIHGGGNLFGNSGSINGSVILGGQNFKGPSLSVSGPIQTNVPFVPSLDLLSVSNFFASASQTWGGLAPTATWNNVYGQIVVSNLSSGKNVVNLSLSDLNSAWGIALNGPSDAYVIINILDAAVNNALIHDITFNLSGGLTKDGVLYNLPNAESLLLSGGQYLSILAPFADVTHNPGLVTGNLVAENLYGSGQVNLGSFIGFKDYHVGVPEPSTYLILGSLLGGVMFLAYRRRKHAHA